MAARNELPIVFAIGFGSIALLLAFLGWRVFEHRSVIVPAIQRARAQREVAADPIGDRTAYLIRSRGIASKLVDASYPRPKTESMRQSRMATMDSLLAAEEALYAASGINASSAPELVESDVRLRVVHSEQEDAIRSSRDWIDAGESQAFSAATDDIERADKERGICLAELKALPH